MDAESFLRDHHGVARWADLRATGMTLTELRLAVKSKRLRLLRRGWYATANAHPTVVSAVTAGGVCGCVSALRLHGVWIPEGETRVHTRARSSAHNDKTVAKKFCRRYGRPQPEGDSVDDVATALAHAVRCLGNESIVVVLDSILHLTLMSREEIETLLRTAPKTTQVLLDRSAAAEAGTETMARYRLASRNIAMRTQVDIPGVGRVDLLVGKRLIIEVDGEKYHSSSEQFHADRARDLAAARLGYLVIRLSYRQVVHEWTDTEAALLDIVRRGDHLHDLPPADAEQPGNDDPGTDAESPDGDPLVDAESDACLDLGPDADAATG